MCSVAARLQPLTEPVQVDAMFSTTRSLRLQLTIIAAAVAVAALSVAHAQQPATLRADIAQISDGGYPYARAVVNLDAEGATLAGLTGANFVADVDGKTVQVKSADLAVSQDLPLDVLFVMDVSGSMSGEPIARAKDAARGFLAGLAPADRVAVLSFSDSVQLVLDYTTDRAAASAAIDGLRAQGNTALYDATAAAVTTIASSTAARKAVILLSDGAQDGVTLATTRDQALAAAASANAPIFAVGEGKGIDRDYLNQLAAASRGRYLEAPDPRDLTALYDGIAKLLRSQYIVTFDASAAVASGSPVSIALHTDAGSASATATYKPGASFAPAPLTVEGLQGGETVADARVVTVSASGRQATKVAFYVDDVNVYETATQPYTYTFDPRTFAPGPHTLRVSASFGARASDASVAFSSEAAAVAPSGGGSMLPIVLGAGGGVVLALLVFVGLRVRVARRDEAPSTDRVVPWAASVVPRALAPVEDPAGIAQPEAVGEPLGVLISRAGPDLGAEYTVGASPVGVGSGPFCAVRVDDPELASEEARIWVRGGHLMVHRVTRLTTMVNDGTMGGWSILEPGDTLEIGRHRLEFRLVAEQDASAEGGGVPNVLRDPETPRDQSSQAPPPDTRRSAFTDLMPRNDWGANAD
jgi:VWFA-related protein